RLREYGADVSGAMERFLNDEDLYKVCYDVLLQDEAFENLGEALKEQNYEVAFECAHTLKGVIGNMGLSPIYKVVCGIVEDLRQKEVKGLNDSYKELMSQLEELKKMK
ncbi:MAG: Hpt domain-containing protein, partial [Oscillospiraceae bacterium]